MQDTDPGNVPAGAETWEKVIRKLRTSSMPPQEGRYTETLEGRRLATNNALTTPIKKDIFMASGSDNLPIWPMVGLYAAVTRKGERGSYTAQARQSASQM